MSTVDQINAYKAAGPSNNNSSSGTGTSKTLNTTDFLKLLAAQMSNQDVMNPTQDTEFLSQMAQFTSLQATQDMSKTIAAELLAIQNLSQISYTQYGSSLVGKNVVVAVTDKDGKVTQDQGMVTSADFSSGSCVLMVNDKKYDITSVMKVVNDAGKTPAKDSGAGDGGTKTTA